MSLKVIFKHAYLRTFCSKTSDSHIIAIHQACKDLLIIKVKKKKNALTFNLSTTRS